MCSHYYYLCLICVIVGIAKHAPVLFRTSLQLIVRNTKPEIVIITDRVYSHSKDIALLTFSDSDRIKVRIPRILTERRILSSVTIILE